MSVVACTCGSSSCDLLSADDVTELLFYFHKETLKLQTVTLETHTHTHKHLALTVT